MADVLPPGVEPSDGPPGVDTAPKADSLIDESLIGEEPSQNEKTDEEPKKKNLYNGEYDLDEDNPLAGSGDEDDGIQVTIGEIKPVNVQFSLNRTHHERHHTSKLDIDSVPLINDQPIYDVDLASMEDRPWRKPGADINDYFNYGFTEETWNTYCERQKKLRTEFTSQAAVNKALFSNIHLANPLGMPAMSTRHANIGSDNIGNVKVLTDNGGRFKVHHHNARNDEPVMRTVIGAPPSMNTNLPPPAMDFSKPPPGMNLPPPNISTLGAPPGTDATTEEPPGVGPPGITPSASSSSVAPPGIDGPPGIEMTGQSTIPTVGSGLDMSVPPPVFNPSLPPPGMSVRPPPIGLPTMGPPGYNNMLPPPGYNGVRYPMNPAGTMGRPRPLMERGYERQSGDMDDERRYRRRSRSRSPRRNDRRRDERDDRRDRDRSDRKDRDRDRTERSRRHRSRSREDRDKRRERKEDDSDRKRRRHDEDDDRKERRERRRDRTPDDESQDVLREEDIKNEV